MRLGWSRPQVLGRGMLGVLLVAAIVGAFVAPAGVRRAAAQDASVQTRVQVLHAATDLGKIEVHFNDDEALDEFMLMGTPAA